MVWAGRWRESSPAESGWKDHAASSPAFKRSAIGLPNDSKDVLEELFTEIHRALMYLGSADPDCSGMGATLSLCWFTPGWTVFRPLANSPECIIIFPCGKEESNRLVMTIRCGLALPQRKRSANWEARQHPRRNALHGCRVPGTSLWTRKSEPLLSSPEIFSCFLTLNAGRWLSDAQILDILALSQPFGPESNPAQRLVRSQ